MRTPTPRHLLEIAVHTVHGVRAASPGVTVVRFFTNNRVRAYVCTSSQLPPTIEQHGSGLSNSNRELASNSMSNRNFFFIKVRELKKKVIRPPCTLMLLDEKPSGMEEKNRHSVRVCALHLYEGKAFPSPLGCCCFVVCFPLWMLHFLRQLSIPIARLSGIYGKDTTLAREAKDTSALQV